MVSMTAGSPNPASVSWLVADIGGTHARFGLIDGPGRSIARVQRLRAAEHASLIEAVRAYLASLPPSFPAPTRACFAVAAPLEGDAVTFTNSHWNFLRSKLRSELGLDQLQVLNDFEALALALPRLGSDGLRAHGVRPRPRGSLAVVGPGTGLGVAGLIETATGWCAIPGEGGHATLSAADDFETAVLAAARCELEHVSAERLLSGLGLPLLHRAVGVASGRCVDVEAPSAEFIVKRGSDGSDAGCALTLSVFCAMLGSFAGNVALTLGARGGLYIGGGIVPRIADLFFASAFRERFEAKGRYRAYLQAIPTALILDPQAALIGAALALEQTGTDST